MLDKRLKRTIKEAKRFLDMAERLYAKGTPDGKLAATVRRRSMDLTNSLADLRKSSYIDIPKH